MANVYQLAREQRAALLDGDLTAAARMVRTYRDQVMPAVERELAGIIARADRLVERGEPIGPAVLYQRGRAETLLAEAEQRMRGFMRSAQAETQAQAREGLDVAMNGAPEAVDAALPPGYAVDFAATTPANLEAVVAMSEAATAGMVNLGSEQAQVIRDALTDAVSRGRHPREMARWVRDQAGLPLTRALTIARTEQLRAYRTGSSLIYQQPQVERVMDGWVWLSAADSRTCAACWAMHGSFHPVDEVMGSHPNCRCTMVPKSKPWRDLGFDSDDEPQMPTPGPTLFRQLSDRDQRRILGPGAFDSYRRGDLELDDLLGRTSHPTYGPGIRRRGLADARERAALRKAGGQVDAPVRTPPAGGTPVPPPDALPAAPDLVPAAAPPRGTWDATSTPAGQNLRVDHREGLARVHDDLAAVGITPPADFRVPFTTTPEISASRPGALGAFYPSGRPSLDPFFGDGDTDGVIALSYRAEGAKVRTVMHHELGHALDRAAYTRSGAPDPEVVDSLGLLSTRPTFLSVESTAEWWTDFRREAIAAHPGLDNVARTIESGRVAERHTKRGRYLIAPEELWARAFQQYVGTRRGIKGWGGTGTIGAENGFWTAEQFARLEPLVERVMREEGWMK